MSNGIYNVSTRDGVQLRVKDWGDGPAVPHGSLATHKQQISDELLAFLRR